MFNCNSFANDNMVFRSTNGAIFAENIINKPVRGQLSHKISDFTNNNSHVIEYPNPHQSINQLIDNVYIYVLASITTSALFLARRVQR